MMVEMFKVLDRTVMRNAVNKNRIRLEEEGPGRNSLHRPSKKRSEQRQRIEGMEKRVQIQEIFTG